MVGTSATSVFASAREDGNAERDQSQASASADTLKKEEKGKELPAAAAAAAPDVEAPSYNKALLDACEITPEMAAEIMKRAENVRQTYAEEIQFKKENPKRLFLFDRPSAYKAGLLEGRDEIMLPILARAGYPGAKELLDEIDPMLQHYGLMRRMVH